VAYRQLRPKGQTLTDLRNEGIVDGYHRLTVQESSIRHSLKRDETILIDGDFKGHTSDAPHTEIKAVQGAQFSSLVKATDGATIEGVTFKGEGVLVEVTGTMPAMFKGCTFIRDAGTNLTTAFVTVAAGSKATFIGCRFRSDEDAGVMQGALNAVVNDGANPAASVTVVSGVNETGWPHLNVTLFGEV
tara:strand:+ start:3120 stop:3683 length:564 start_codon:yes stop_codon:yes gene_type:complete